MDNMITVIIPIYNCEKYLERCLESVISQTYKNLEILLINDGSTDNSKKICDYYLCKDSRIKLINKENSGVSDTRNVGIKEAGGDYIAFVDADDFIEYDMYEKMLKKSVENNCDMVFCDYIEFNDKGIANSESISVNEFVKTRDLKYFIAGKNTDRLMGSIWRILFKKNVVENLRFNKDIILGEDLLFVLQALSNNKKISSVNEKLYHYYFQSSDNYKKYLNNPKYYKSQQLLTENIVRILRENNREDLAKCRAWETYLTTYKTALSVKDYRDRIRKLKKNVFYANLNTFENYNAYKKFNANIPINHKIRDFLIRHQLFLVYKSITYIIRGSYE